MTDTFVISGGLGCVGAWVATLLAREDARAVVFDLTPDEARLRLVATPEERERMVVVTGDLLEADVFANLLLEHAATHVIHLAALQAPACRERPSLGAHVNVVGTARVFEAARSAGLGTPLVYASSAAAFGIAGALEPDTLYGVYKLADEGIARVFWADDGVASVGLRPACVYGPGRDTGLTAAVTQAMTSAALGRPFRIPFDGRLDLHFAADVARALIHAARSGASGANLYAMPTGGSLDMNELVTVLETVVPGAASLIDVDEVPLPFAGGLSGEPYDVPVTGIEDGIRETIRVTAAA